MNMTFRSLKLSKGVVRTVVVTLAVCGVVTALADPKKATDLTSIANNITSSFSSIGKLMIATAYLAGIGFTIAAIFKFKQHKDNPTQIPIGTPLAMFVIGVILIFMPMLISPAGKTIFGTGGTAGGFQGGGVTGLPGGSSSSGGGAQ